MNANPSLYDKIGGEAGVEALVIEFYVKVLADPLLAPFFSDTSLAKLHLMQKQFFIMALGGPETYEGRPLAAAHHGLHIRPEHLTAFTGHLLSTLEDQGIEQVDAQAVCDRINSHANEVTGTSY